MKRLILPLVVVLLAAPMIWWISSQDSKVESGFLIRIDTLPADGAVPQPLFVRRLDVTTPEPPIQLVPVPDQARMFRAPGAPKGQYEIFNDAGWRIITDTMLSPTFDPAAGPTAIAMGRPACIYVCRDPHVGFQVESVLAAERIEGTAKAPTYRAIDAEIVEHIEGWFGVRLPPEEVQEMARFRISGWLAGQVPFDPIIVNLGVDPNRPFRKFARPASVAPLRVVLIGSSDATIHDVEVRAEMVGLPMKMVDVAKSISGEVVFPSLGAFKDGVMVRVPSWNRSVGYSISVDQWRREGTMFLRVPDEEHAMWVDLKLAEGASVQQVAGIDAETNQFALLPLDLSEGRVRVQVSPDIHALVIFDGDMVTYEPVSISGLGAQGEEMPLALGAPTRAVRVHGRVNTSRPGYRVRFERNVAAEDKLARWVGGVGMEIDVRVGFRYETRLPPGKYRVRVVPPAGRAGEPMVLEWGPGANVELPLDIR